MKVKYGIIGCGSISRFHFNGLEKLGAEIVHIADLNEQAAKPYVDKFGAKFSKDYKDVINDPDVTVVSILTSSKYHKEIALAALKAGKDVICEKTMMDNAVEAEEVAKVALASGNLFFTAFMKRFFPATQKAKELLPSLGRLFSAQVRSYQCWDWSNFYEIENDKGNEWILNNYGGAVMKCAGSHMMDVTMFLLGRPQSIYAHVDYVPNSKIDRKATALFEYENGFVANFETAVHQLKKIGYERNSWDEYIEINGVNGRLTLSTVMWDHPENNAPLLVHYNNEKGTTTEYRFDIVNPFDLEMKHIHEALEKREQSGPTVVDGFNVDKVIETMVKSSEMKASIKVDWRGL
ncbi:MAG: Gfo/Idh/MocA family oxidoreductase [Vallitaleaceae bacterium]|nr:Gfo/Idh/MocA family oxidoreductase [Vallitaleaceae bacterium]